MVNAATVEAAAFPSTVSIAPSVPYADGEHKLVTLLCGALAEARTLASRLGPELWYHLLQTMVGLAQEVLRHYGGTLTRAALSIAIEMYRAMDMTLWIPQVEAELTQTLRNAGNTG